MQYTNLAGLPDSLFQALTNDDYEVEPDSIGITTLIGPARLRVLKERYDDQITIEAADNVHMMLGSAVHRLLADYKGGISEQRYCAVLSGTKVCGIPDLVEHQVLYDYKTSSVWISVFGIRKEWIRQLNSYRWLLRKNDVVVNELKSVVVFKDWSRNSRMENNPLHPATVYDVPMWTLEETEAYILSRIEAHQDAETELPECTAEERWQSDGAFAVYRNSGKRAKRVLDTLEEAHVWIVEHDGDPYQNPLMFEGHETVYKGYAVVKRPDKWRRCEGYCNVAPFCGQWKEFCESQRETPGNST